MTQQIITWWLTSSLFGLAGLPLTTYLFRALPDRGYPFARSLGLLLVGYLAWLLAMFGLAPFDGGLLVVCAAAVFGVGWLACRPRGGRAAAAPGARGVFGRFFPGWQLTLAYELVFVLALVFLAALRARNPDPWGTERPMDFALFNAIQRSGSFPPHDPWLAGFSINYYYGGYMLMAAMNLLAGLEFSVAFNLSLALTFALAALGIAGVVLNLIRLTTHDRRVTIGERRPAAVAGRVFAVALSITFVLLAGNQGGALAVVTGVQRVLYLSGGDMARAVVNGLGPRAPLVLNTPVQEWGADEPVTSVTPSDMWQNFDSWWPSRAVWDSARTPGDPQVYYAITEFPMFSFFLGDMHPHVMALPFALLAIALALTTLARPSAPVFTLTWHGWLELVLTGVVLGSLYVINSWDFPTYMLLYLAALATLYWRLGRNATGARLPFMWQPLVQQVLMVGMASFVTWLPFHATVKSLVGSREALIDLPLLGTLTRTIGVVTWTKTPLYSFLIIFGLFLVPLVGLLIMHGRTAHLAAQDTQPGGDIVTAPAAANALGIVARPVSLPALLPSMPWAVLGGLVIGLVAGFPLLFLLPLAIYAVLLALREEQPGPAFALLALALGGFICFGTELIYIRDNFEGSGARMNTIFKFYYQVWLLWGMLAGYAVWALVHWNWKLVQGSSDSDLTKDERRKTNDDPRPTNDRGAGFRLPSFVFRRVLPPFLLVLTAMLLGAALIYPYQTALKQLREQPAIGLEGRTPRQRTAGGAAGIAWLRENTRGNEVVLEAVGDSYDQDGGAGVSASTGLATVLGWHGSHESLWRGGDPAARAEIAPRLEDAEVIYSTGDANQARELLTKYHVDYVYIGEYERNRYGGASLDKFAQIGEQVFTQDEVVIYRVRE